jgi:tetratricopeptide (TPR) repeat protein
MDTVKEAVKLRRRGFFELAENILATSIKFSREVPSITRGLIIDIMQCLGDSVRAEKELSRYLSEHVDQDSCAALVNFVIMSIGTLNNHSLALRCALRAKEIVCPATIIMVHTALARLYFHKFSDYTNAELAFGAICSVRASQGALSYLKFRYLLSDYAHLRQNTYMTSSAKERHEPPKVESELEPHQSSSPSEDGNPNAMVCHKATCDDDIETMRSNMQRFYKRTNYPGGVLTDARWQDEIECNYALAKQYYEMSLLARDCPYDPVLACFEYAVFLQFKMKDYVAARSMYQRAIQADPLYCEAHFRLGKLHFHHFQDIAAAFDCFRKVLAINAHHQQSVEYIHHIQKSFARS